MSIIKVLQGEIFSDYRGSIKSLNNFDFEGVQRMYTIKHPDPNVIRGWHGHQFEKKWFYCIKGEFSLAFVKIDDWKNPSPDLTTERFTLNESNSQIICLPAGYANCIKATMKESILLVLSGALYPKCLEDSWRWEPKMWGGNLL